ncbi:spoIIIJ-associated protein [Anaerospora hongkongensis]|uniref:RNA-binding protein KhpB n=1 Tax=Anaerospora hongkongensis TaxID=244830 RepID=A0A4R1PVX9_9FIRM|nr:RNA-binding cell elongation regulator Jag/EloR [Anaerospora hongkongensis]TCL34438.1 spoIIIJ-associated protein [Anaerospora hongkongensis]
MNVVEKSAKSIDEAVEQALSELGLKPEQVEVEVLEQPAKALFGFIGGRMAKVRVTARQIDPVEVANEFLKQIFTTMKITVSVEQITTEDHVLFNLRGNDLGVLIGKHGQTLDALQYLVNLAANRDSAERVRVLLDVEDYRKRRADTLTQLALRLADKVKRRGEKVVLEPMSSHERKIIHMALQNDHRIATYSEGEDPFRKVVIALKR